MNSRFDFRSRSISECLSSPFVVVNFLTLDFYSQTIAWICFKYCVDVSWVNLYQVYKNWITTPFFRGKMANSMQFSDNSLKKILWNRRPETSHKIMV